MVSMGLNYLLLWQEFVIEWNLWQECWIVSFQDYVNDLRDNLCCWFSLHVKSGHCSHLDLHMYMSSAYYLSICILSAYYLQWSLISSFLTDNANVIHTSSLLLFIYSIMENMSSAPFPDDVLSAPLPDDMSSAPLRMTCHPHPFWMTYHLHPSRWHVICTAKKHVLPLWSLRSK